MGQLLAPAHCPLSSAVSFRYRHQREGPWEECTQAAGAPRSTVLTVPALWIIAAAAFPALSTPMKVRLQPRGRARTMQVVGWDGIGSWRQMGAV